MEHDATCEATCPAGYRGTASTYTCGALGEWIADDTALDCKDIDECKEGTDECEDVCTNTPGGYDCSCPKSRLKSDGKSCEPRKLKRWKLSFSRLLPQRIGELQGHKISLWHNNGMTVA